MKGWSGPYTEPLTTQMAYATSRGTDMLAHVKLPEKNRRVHGGRCPQP